MLLITTLIIHQCYQCVLDWGRQVSTDLSEDIHNARTYNSFPWFSKETFHSNSCVPVSSANTVLTCKTGSFDSLIDCIRYAKPSTESKCTVFTIATENTPFAHLCAKTIEINRAPVFQNPTIDDKKRTKPLTQRQHSVTNRLNW